jgi:hypothetical protein
MLLAKRGEVKKKNTEKRLIKKAAKIAPCRLLFCKP